jgi:hypothetical protein
MINLCFDHYTEVLRTNPKVSLQIVGWGDCDMCRREIFHKLAHLENLLNTIAMGLEQGVTIKEYDGPDMVDY